MVTWPPATHQDVQNEISTLRSALFNVKAPAYGAVGDGVADDTTALQNAINDAQTAKGSVYLPQGTYLTGPLTVSADVAIRGSGWGTKLKLKNASNGYIITLSPGTGFLFVDFRDFSMDGNAANQTSGGCINASGAVQSRFDSIHFTYAYDVCLFVQGNANNAYGHHNRITRCLFDYLNTVASATQQGIRFQNSDENFVAFCDFENWGGLPATPGAEPYAIKDWSGLQEIIGNVFVNGQEAIRVQDSKSTRIIGNTFDGCGRSGVHLSGGRNVVMGNLFSDGSSSNTGFYAQCEVDYSSSATIVGNSFLVTTAGIVRNCVWEHPTNSSKTLVVDNTADLQGTLFGGNKIIDLNCAGSKAANNIPWNPVGTIAAPAVPASGTAYTNQLHADCEVFVSGGTVTGVSVGGTATGLTSGSFRVPVGQTITLTYSVAPTWVWLGD